MSLPEFSSVRSYQSPYDLAQGHLDTLKDSDLQTAEYFGRCLGEDGPLASTVVIIPVAAHQESSNIYPALSEYARQDTDQPFTVVLGMNAPENLTDPNVQASYHELNRARDDFPHLDVRDVFMQYLEAPIGTIRADLWNGVIVAGLNGGTLDTDRDIIGVNHDIDLIKLPQHYIKSVQEYGKQPWQNTLATYTQIRHAYDPDHPNVSRYLQWLDYVYQELEVGYEASAVIPLHTYITKGGINPSRVTYEINGLLNKTELDPVIKSGKLHTSPRRYIARLAAHGPDKIWTDDSFSNNDKCRTTLTTEDIREDYLDNLLAETNDVHLEKIIQRGDPATRTGALTWNNLILGGKSAHAQEKRNEHYLKIQQRMRLKRNVASRIMRSCVERPAIADQIDVDFNDARLDLMAQESIDRLVRFRQMLLPG